MSWSDFDHHPHRRRYHRHPSGSDDPDESDDDDDEDDDPLHSTDGDGDRGRLYAVLNVPRGADGDADAESARVQRHYKRLSRAYHPDKIVLQQHRQHRQHDAGDTTTPREQQEQQDRAAAAREGFVAIKTAADVLGDPVYRLAYDCGGLLAVTLVRRSQAQAAAGRQRQRPRGGSSSEANGNESDAGDDDDSDDDGAPRVDLYSALQQAASKAEAVRLVRRVLREHRRHQRRAARPHLDVACRLPQVLTGDATVLRRESALLQVHSSRHSVFRRRTVAAAVHAGFQVEATAETSLTAGASLDGQVARGTHCVADVSLSSSSSRPSVSLRTSRQTAAGTVLVAALGGPLARHKLSQWNASLVSYRTLLLGATGSSNSAVQKLQAVWRLAFNVRGQLRHLSASLRTVPSDDTAGEHDAAAMWRCRLALATYPLKVSWRGASPADSSEDGSDNSGTFYASGSWAPRFVRLKLLRIRRLGGGSGGGGSEQQHRSGGGGSPQWTLKYGLKFDGKAAYSTRGSPFLWTVLFALDSHSLTLRLPIGVLPAAAAAATTAPPPPIAWVASLLAAEWVDQHLLAHLPWHGKENDRDPLERSASSSTFLNGGRGESESTNNRYQNGGAAVPPYYRSVVRSVASKKRALEKETTTTAGLVIASAVLLLAAPSPSSGSSSREDDVTDLLQFCVVDGRLHLAWDDPRWSWWMPAAGIATRQPPYTTAGGDERGDNWVSWLWRKSSLVWENAVAAVGLSTKAVQDATTAPRLGENEGGSLRIRYQFQGTLYEVTLRSPSPAAASGRGRNGTTSTSIIQLPHPEATALGPTDRVS